MKKLLLFAVVLGSGALIASTTPEQRFLETPARGGQASVAYFNMNIATNLYGKNSEWIYTMEDTVVVDSIPLGPEVIRLVEDRLAEKTGMEFSHYEYQTPEKKYNQLTGEVPGFPKPKMSEMLKSPEPEYIATVSAGVTTVGGAGGSIGGVSLSGGGRVALNFTVQFYKWDGKKKKKRYYYKTVTVYSDETNNNVAVFGINSSNTGVSGNAIMDMVDRGIEAVFDTKKYEAPDW